LDELDYFFGDGAEDQGTPTGDAVRGDDNHVNTLPLHRFEDVSDHVIANFDAGS
jgi:hypothetical protein